MSKPKKPSKEQKLAAAAAKGAEVKARLLAAVEEFRAYTNENMASSVHRKTSWTTPGPSEREYPRFTREAAAEKARQFVEEQPIVAGLVTGLTDSIVGSGYRLSMQTAEREWNKEVEAWHMERRDMLDIRRIRTWGQIGRCLWARRFIDGDVGLYKQTLAGGKGEPSARRVSIIEAERIRWRKWDYLDSGSELPSQWKVSPTPTPVKVDQGIAYDSDGRMVGAFIGPRPSNQMAWEEILKEGRFVGADQFTLYMNMVGDRVDPIRGMSAMLCNFNLFLDISEILKNVIQKIKNEAFIALAFGMEQGLSGNVFGEAESVKTGEDGKKRKHVKMVPGMNLSLAPNEKVDLLGLKTPNAELMPFVRFVMRIAGTPYGFPLEMLLLDVSETNFSGGRLLLELAKRRQRVEQDGLAMVCSDIFRWDLAGAISDKELKPPAKLATPTKHRWGKPSLPYYDPGREAQANGMNLDRLLVAPQDIIAEAGEQDAEDILDKWEAWIGECKKRELPVIFGTVSTRIADEENPSGDIKPKPATTKQDAGEK